jgi:co-chaperonin GroES (HSP10)
MYTPLKDKIIVERIQPLRETASGIILKSAVEPDRAKVIAIGPDVDEVSIGEECLVNWNAAIKIKDEIYSIRIEHVVMAYVPE